MSNLYRVKVRDVGTVAEWYQIVALSLEVAVMIAHHLHIRKGLSEFEAVELICKNWIGLI